MRNCSGLAQGNAANGIERRRQHAAVTCHLARDRRGGPHIVRQLLVCPVRDCTFDRSSYNDKGIAFFVTRGLMYWFLDLFARLLTDRSRVSPVAPRLPCGFQFQDLQSHGCNLVSATAVH